MKKIVIIPARMASKRFPNKPLVPILGTSMIERVWNIGSEANGKDELYIATDDLRLKEFAENFGATVLMTSPSCITGTDRVAEASQILGYDDAIYFNLQGDAVLTPPWVVDAVLQEMGGDESLQMATPAVLLKGQALDRFVEQKSRGSSSGTAVVFDRNKNALYFSKALIPFRRDGLGDIYQHIGLYGYRKETLGKLSHLPEGCLEKAEKLEQLRALENGISIRVVEVDYRGKTHGSVDRPEDVATIEAILRSENTPFK
jgi:3-deoxy-manno-octulosonate cytidylyltransferase (CMP-KDO synthetase)